MESTERLKQKVLQEKRLANRLGWSQTRLEAAERERIWAIASAHTQGLSIRKIATATTLSSSRVHQGLWPRLLRNRAIRLKASWPLGYRAWKLSSFRRVLTNGQNSVITTVFCVCHSLLAQSIPNTLRQQPLNLKS